MYGSLLVCMGLFWYVWVSIFICLISSCHICFKITHNTPRRTIIHQSLILTTPLVCMGLLWYTWVFWYICVSFGIYESHLVYMGLSWYIWVSFGIHGSLLVYMGLFWYVWVSIFICLICSCHVWVTNASGTLTTHPIGSLKNRFFFDDSFVMYGSLLVCMGVNIHMFDMFMSHILQDHSQHNPIRTIIYRSLLTTLLACLGLFWYV